MNIKLLREIIREEIERLNREKPIKEVLVREMHYDPKDSKRRVPDTIKEVEWIEDPKTGKRRKIERNKPVEPIYYHFSTLEEALEFMKEIEEKYRNYPIKLPIEKPLPGVLRIGAVEYMIIVRRFKEEELREYGPFRKGDLVSEGALPKHVVEVLLKRGIVVPYSAKL